MRFAEVVEREGVGRRGQAGKEMGTGGLLVRGRGYGVVEGDAAVEDEWEGEAAQMVARPLGERAPGLALMVLEPSERLRERQDRYGGRERSTWTRARVAGVLGLGLCSG